MVCPHARLPSGTKTFGYEIVVSHTFVALAASIGLDSHHANRCYIWYLLKEQRRAIAQILSPTLSIELSTCNNGFMQTMAAYTVAIHQSFLCSVKKTYFEASARACAAPAWPARSPGPNDCRLVLPSFRFGKSGTLDILSYALASRSHNRVKKHKTREAGHLLYAVLETREAGHLLGFSMRCLCCTLHPACNHFRGAGKVLEYVVLWYQWYYGRIKPSC